MKLSPILAQYLLSNKQLSLPGIGRLILSQEMPAKGRDSSQAGKTSPTLSITFTNNSSEVTDDELINYIAKESGKMKSLASADFNSHIGLAKEILYSGKPFLLEGIGTLSINKDNQFNFIPESSSVEKTRETVPDAGTVSEESFTDYNNILLKGKNKEGHGKRILAGIIILGGIVLAVWGGYTIYKKNMNKASDNGISESGKSNLETKPVKDSANLVASSTSRDSVSTYRFIIEQAGLARVLNRYNQLKSYGLNVKMATADSAVYKVFFELPATPADTARISDSLTNYYKLKGEKKVWAE